MNYEYALFNILVLTGPLVFSFDRHLRFFKHWKQALQAMIVPMLVFIVWDILVTGRHWNFNEAYTLPLRIGGLPIEEIAFFITVPFACIFTWEVIQYYIPRHQYRYPNFLQYAGIAVIIPGVLLFVFSTKEYTALVLIAMGISAIADRVAKVNLLAQRNYYILALLIIGMTTLFNGYLTLRPVVLYNELYLSGIRLGSIPIEDYGYGLVLIHGCLIIYERLRRRTDETR